MLLWLFACTMDTQEDNLSETKHLSGTFEAQKISVLVGAAENGDFEPCG